MENKNCFLQDENPQKHLQSQKRELENEKSKTLITHLMNSEESRIKEINQKISQNQKIRLAIFL